MYKSQFLNELNKRIANNPFFHLTGSREEKSYIRNNNCTYKEKIVYGGSIATIKDKKTNEKIEIQVIKY